MIRINTEKALAKAKIDKIAQLKKLREEKLSQGFSYKGGIFKLNDSTIVNIQLKVECPLEMSNRYQFFDKDKSLIDFENSSELEKFKDEIFAAKDAIMVYYNQKYIEVANCKSITAIDEIVIDF